ncbi:MAG: RNA polymerase sigma factor [Bacteroidaceae bacterium]|nr:RNA polymerase sigma factor [Bacteroidaceae bacterium]
MTREQFTELVVAEQEALRRFLLTLCCGNRDDADDLAQEALVKAYLASGSLRDGSKVKAWLYKIAYNTFISSRRSTQTIVSIDDTTDIVDNTLAPDREYKYQELYAALAQMQPKERTALVLFYLNGNSVKEISIIVECSEAAVRQQLSRGREHLKKYITQYGER